MGDVVVWAVRTAAAWVALATLLPLVRRDAWWIRACEFPRVQILGAAIIGLIVLPFLPVSALESVLLATALTASALFQAYRILPFTRLWRRQDSPRVSADGGGCLSVLVSNILMTNREAASFLRTVREVAPDIVLVLEADSWWQLELDSLRESHPHTIEHPQDDTYGMLLFSRVPIDTPEVRFLVEDEVPSIRCTLTVEDSHAITFYGLHPKPPAPQETTDTTERDAELLLVAKEVRGSSGATIVGGDLNDVAWSYTTRLFRRVSGLLDPRIGRSLLSTFPAAVPWLRVPLDHLFHSADLALVDLRRVRVAGSDHLSIYACLRWDGEPEAADTPTPEPGDVDLADEKIEEGLRGEEKAG